VHLVGFTTGIYIYVSVYIFVYVYIGVTRVGLYCIVLALILNEHIPMHVRYIGYLVSVRGGHIAACVPHWRGSGSVPGGQKNLEVTCA
jgi:hypothetical protein